MLVAFSGVAFFLATTVGLSDLLGYTLGVYESPMYLAQDLLLPVLAVYIAARSSADAASAPATDEEAKGGDAK